MKNSRTTYSIRNSGVALFIYFINLILQFWSRKIFIEYLGVEILGLNTTTSNLLQFLNLAELGISSAISFSLYKPIEEGNQETINEIITLQGNIYKLIAGMIILGSILIMIFFPYIFKKTELPLWYAYLSFGSLLFSSLLGYFVNYKQVILSASQQEYKITFFYKGTLLLKILVQMLAVYYFSNGFLWWCILEIAFACIASYILHIVTLKSFPDLRSSKKGFRYLRHKYKVIETKIKQLFFHKVAGFGLTQLSPIILYAYTSLSEVTYYQNYMLMYYGLVSLFIAIFNGMIASIGNVSTKNPEKLVSIFNELFSIRFYLSSIISFGFYKLSSIFVSLWIGEEYILHNSTVFLLTIILFIALSRQTVENYLSSLGLFQDIWAPITELIINIGLSVLLGYYCGLNGILIGIITSLIVIVLVWKPIFLYKKGFKISYLQYVRLYAKHVFALILTVGLTAILNLLFIKIENGNPLLSLIEVLIFSVILLIIMIEIKSGIIFFIRRLKRITHSL